MGHPARSPALQSESPPASGNALAGIALLSGQPEATLRRLEEVSLWHAFPQGAKIFDQDDSQRDVYFIVDGSVRVVAHAQSGQEVAIHDLHAGDHFGELSAIDGEARAATLYALEDCAVAVVPGEAFVAFLKEHPEVARRLMVHLTGIIRSLNNRVVGLSATTVVQGVYAELLRMAEPNPTFPRRSLIDPMPNHRDIAVLASTTPETVARAIGRLLEAKVVKRRNQTLHVLDRQRLEQMAAAG